jgi:hypothetical protein
VADEEEEGQEMVSVVSGAARDSLPARPPAEDGDGDEDEDDVSVAGSFAANGFSLFDE